MKPDELDVRSVFVPVRNGDIHVVEHRPANVTKSPVLFVHGFPETWWSWRHQIAALGAAGHPVLAIDLRGYGASTKRGPFTLTTLAADVAEVIRVRADGRAAVVGHDWGGAAAWSVAALHPERVSRVVVLNCPLPEVMQEQLIRKPSRTQLKKSWYIFFFQVPVVPELLLSRNGGRAIAGLIRRAAKRREHMSDDELRPFCEAASSRDKVAGMLGPYRAALRSAVAMEPLPPIAQPSLLIWGLDDPALGFDALAPETERRIPGLRVEPIADCGHFPHAEQPEYVNRLLKDFLG